MGSFFSLLCILKFVDQLELFLLHSCDIRLVLGLLICVTSQLGLDLLPYAILTLKLIHLALLRGLHLLVLDHLLHPAGSLFLLVSLLIVELLESGLISLRIHRCLPLLVKIVDFALLVIFSSLSLQLSILLTFHVLLHHHLTVTFLLHLLSLNVSLTL